MGWFTMSGKTEENNEDEYYPYEEDDLDYDEELDLNYEDDED